MNRLFLLILLLIPLLGSAQKETSWKEDSLYLEGKFYAKNGAYDHALKCYLSALKQNEKGKNDIAVCRIKNAIGLLHVEVGNTKMAKKYLTASLSLAESINDTEGIAHANNNFGILAQNQGNYELATQYYVSSLQFKRELKDSIGISRSLGNLGTVEVDKKNYRGALNYYFQSLDVKLALKDSSGLAVIYSNIGDAYGNLGILDSTQFYLFKGLVIAKKLNQLPVLAQYYRNLSALYSELNNKELELNYLHLYLSAQDSVFDNSLAEELARQEVKFQVSSKEKELEISESKNALLEKDKEVKLRNAQVLWGFLIALSVGVVLLVLLLRFRSKTIAHERLARERERELTELNLKNEQNQKKQLLYEKEMVDRELLLISMQTLKKQEMLSSLYENVLSTKKSGKASDNDILNSTLLQLKANLNAEDDWDNFKFYFEKVHPAFFLNISEKFPELSQTDHRHMAYILIGLNTKEIARLMSITPASVQKSRVRLKKKLQLEKEESLTEFIRNI